MEIGKRKTNQVTKSLIIHNENRESAGHIHCVNLVYTDSAREPDPEIHRETDRQTNAPTETLAEVQRNRQSHIRTITHGSTRTDADWRGNRTKNAAK